MTANINPFYFSLYAALKRSALANNGYPSQVPFYSPPRRGDVDSEPPDLVTDDDWATAVAIESAVNSIRQRDKRHRVLAERLDIWEGAYTSAPPTRAARCKQHRVGYETCKKAANRCKKEVERLMYGQ